ncbi:hypothetical protein GY45DRAFT_39644 [Cubamyces sp. BRFM 1775]|nr:hypothetical protein GY45DRAFT_39644 [Cubamyces sp. BRFM 1775]
MASILVQIGCQNTPPVSPASPARTLPPAARAVLDSTHTPSSDLDIPPLIHASLLHVHELSLELMDHHPFAGPILSSSCAQHAGADTSRFSCLPSSLTESAFRIRIPLPMQRGSIGGAILALRLRPLTLCFTRMAVAVSRLSKYFPMRRDMRRAQCALYPPIHPLSNSRCSLLYTSLVLWLTRFNVRYCSHRSMTIEPT